MAIFKYTVANKEGKKLSGTIEADSEETARKELNGLGFSIFALQETQSLPTLDQKLKKFTFEGVDKNSNLLSGTIPAETEQEAASRLESEYNLTITAIWPDGASEEEIKKAQATGSAKLQEQLKIDLEESKTKNLEQQKQEAFIKTKIETILKQVTDLLQKFDQQFDPEQKAGINKRINKLLRIKNSNNYDYILTTAHELLSFIEEQEKSFKEKGFKEKEFELKVKTTRLLDELNRSATPKTISEDILNRINDWESHHKNKLSVTVKFLAKILMYIKKLFETPPEIRVIKEQIHTYNKQLIEFVKLYFKEPTKEYKDKVKKTLGTIWRARKKAKHSLKQVKKLLRERHREKAIKEQLTLSFIIELNSLTGWLLFFYATYYFVSLYLSTKDFGIDIVPQGFSVYESHIFKYLLVIIFLLHVTTALKVNFFKKSLLANVLLPTFFVFATIITLLNF